MKIKALKITPGDTNVRLYGGGALVDEFGGLEGARAEPISNDERRAAG